MSNCFPLSGGEPEVWSFPSEVGSIGLAESGKLVVALRHSVVLFDPADGSSRTIAEIETNLGGTTRLNDGKVGSDGAFWIGSMDERPRPVSDPQGALYRVTADGKVEQKVTGLFTSNGLAFSPDGRVMFHSDLQRALGGPLDLDPLPAQSPTAPASSRRRRRRGRPDGGATDSEGYCDLERLVCPPSVNRYAPDGTLVAKHAVPVAAPTMPCFAGRGLRTGSFPHQPEKGQAGSAARALSAIRRDAGCRRAGLGSPVSRFRDR